jgi:Domain of unknown function (DUF4440)
MRAGLAAIAGVITLVVASPALAQNKVDPEFLKARQGRIEALNKGDQAAFERYTADEFIVTGPTGAVENKAQRVARANRAQQQPAAFEDEKITPYGDNTVILTWRQSGQGGGGTRFLEVWVKERGMWKVAAVQITPIQIQKP